MKGVDVQLSEKTIKTRIINKHAKESEWSSNSDFIPKNGELIIYDTDENYNYKRLKIGDGQTKINSLNFVDDNLRNIISNLTNDFESFNELITNKIDNLQTLINQNDIQVSETQPSFPCTWFKVTSED